MEETKIEARREKPISDHDRRAAAAHQNNLRQQAAQKSIRATAPKQHPRQKPAERVAARHSVRRRRSQRFRGRVDRARRENRGGRGARPAKRAVNKASAGHEPNGSRPGGPNSSINLEVSASLSVALQAENDFVQRYKGSAWVPAFAGTYAADGKI